MDPDLPITTLLRQWKEGDRTALDRLMPLVYNELRRMAAARLKREPSGQTIEPTALVHEAYIKMLGGRDPDLVNRAHFLGVAARLMRQILVDRARAKHSHKRGGLARVEWDDDLIFTGQRAALVVALDDSLQTLEKQDAEKARILELRYFGGLNAEESSQLLGVSVHHVNRQMRLGQAWLRRELEANVGAGPSAAAGPGFENARPPAPRAPRTDAAPKKSC